MNVKDVLNPPFLRTTNCPSITMPGPATAFRETFHHFLKYQRGHTGHAVEEKSSSP